MAQCLEARTSRFESYLTLWSLDCSRGLSRTVRDGWTLRCRAENPNITPISEYVFECSDIISLSYPIYMPELLVVGLRDSVSLDEG